MYDVLFLEHEYELSKSEDIAIMLSSLDWTLLSDESGPQILLHGKTGKRLLKKQ